MGLEEQSTTKACHPIMLVRQPILMEQYGLGVADFPEIGSKSLISKIMNNERSLTRNHIKALSTCISKVEPINLIPKNNSTDCVTSFIIPFL